MKDHEPTIRSRELGLALTRALDAIGMRPIELARKLGWSPGRVSRLQSGKRYSSPEDIATVLAVCGIFGPRRDALLDLARRASERGWWQEYGDRLPERLTTLSDYEDSTIAVTNFQTVVVPGLLQEDSYARALLESLPVIPKEEVSKRLEARQRRRAILDRRYPAEFWFYLNEYVLTCTGFGREIMSNQVHHLLRMSVRPHVHIRVIPDGVGVHGGQSPFHFMEFTELSPVVHLENLTSVLFIERKDSIESYRRIVADLDRVALGEGHTHAWLVHLAKALGEPREDHDEQPPDDEPHLEEEFLQ